MSDKEARLLQSIVDNGEAVYVHEINSEDYQSVLLLIERGYVIRTGALNLAVYEVTKAGRVALADYNEQTKKLAQEIAEKDSKQELMAKNETRKRRSEWWRFWIGLILGWLLGAVTPVDAWALIVKAFNAFVALFQ